MRNIQFRSSFKHNEIELEAATRGVLQKKLSLKICQYSQENKCIRVYF